MASMFVYLHTVKLDPGRPSQ
uniref:ATK4 n=1 Tax=Arundo donax TaxID=35708 RepID=A0A0A9AH62_ARUDO